MVQHHVAGAEDRHTGSPLVLVVEDDTDIATVITLSLEAEGYQVVTAGDGKAALTEAEQLQPDVILLDIMLPEADGWEVIRALKIKPSTAEIPVVMMTAYANRQDRVRGALAGAQRYLTKPIDLGKLPAMIANAIETQPPVPRPF